MGSTTEMTADQSRATRAGKASKKKRNKKKRTRKAAKKPAEETASQRLADPDPDAAGAERRRAERHDVAENLEVEVELFGYQRDGREFGIGPAPDTSRKIQTFGKTANLSVTGMLARVADEIADNSHCLVRFVNAGEGIRPELRWGLVLRCQPMEDGRFEAAIAFDSPLERLDVGALVAT